MLTIKTLLFLALCMSIIQILTFKNNLKKCMLSVVWKLANVTTYKHINKSEILLFASTNREYLYVFIFVYIFQR